MELTMKFKHKINALPEKPGVYQFIDDNEKIIYIGKAKNIKKRAGSYFNKQSQSVGGKTKVLVRKTTDIKYVVVETEWDALLLENSLIKKFKPKYNVLLRDDKTFPWICIKQEPFPRIFPTRTIRNDGSLYYGPYASVKMMNAILELIGKLYKLRNCNYNLSEQNIKKGKFKVCLEYHIGNCRGPCEGLQQPINYENQIAEIKDIIKGNLSSLNKHLKLLMKKHADKHQYEKAQIIKEKLDTLEKYRMKSVVVNPQIKDVDVFSIVSDNIAGYVNYMKVIQGAIVQSHTVELKKKLDESDEELLTTAVISLLKRFESSAKEIIVPLYLHQSPIFNSNKKAFFVPKKGNKKKLLDLSLRNAKHFQLDKQRILMQRVKKAPSNRILKQIKQDLRLKKLPDHIECFDNSNIQGAYPVAAMVVFKNVKPRKSEYRHYNIKTVKGPDDFASMQEVVFRRYSRLLKEKKPLPKLIVIDGGKGQLSSALNGLKKLGLNGKISIIGIAKRLEEIYYPNDPIPMYLDKRSETLKIIQHLRNEAHRFGIEHHRSKRIKGTIKTELSQITGIGETTASVLLKKYLSVNRIKELPLKKLEELIGKSKGAKVFDYFRS